MSNLNNELSENIFALMRCLKGEFSVEEKTNQITLTQIQMIIFIEQKQKVKMSEIAEYFKIALPSATSLINTLSKKGYVVRSNDPKDRRTVFVSLSLKTISFIKNITAQRTKKIGNLLSCLTEVEKKQLLKIVQKMSQSIGT